MSQCKLCHKSSKTTRHSLIGNHVPPYVRLCETCHKKVHGFIRTNKQEKEEIRSWKKKQFRKKLPYLNY